jgi:DNA-directed RNA polymerase specialized sigma24 family protein
MRGGASRLDQLTVNSQDAHTLIGGAVATYGTPEEIERHILLREVLATLTEEERLICILKKAGFSSQEIAARRGGSAAAVDTLISRIKQKVRDNLRLEPEPRQRKMMLKATDAPRQTPAVRRPRNRGL